MLSENEREHVKAIVEGVSREVNAKIDGIKDLFESKNQAICKSVDELKKSSEKNHVQHDKRISAVESKMSYYLGKVSGIALVVSIIGSVLVTIIKIWVQ